MSRQVLTVLDPYNDAELHILVASTRRNPSGFLNYMRERGISAEQQGKMWRAFLDDGLTPVTYVSATGCYLVTVSGPIRARVESVAGELIEQLGEVENQRAVDLTIEALDQAYRVNRAQRKSRFN
ncbi:MAG: hypothetical protein HY361_03430 [Candidatus Aenigmarchaeota archaeon]|nr:hypothetical protein [Candidatus Aenigmarchaeota archaeon]